MEHSFAIKLITLKALFYHILYTHPMLVVLLLPRFHQSQSRGTIVGFLLLPRFQQSQFVDKYRMCVYINGSVAGPASDIFP